MRAEFEWEVYSLWVRDGKGAEQETSTVQNAKFGLYQVNRCCVRSGPTETIRRRADRLCCESGQSFAQRIMLRLCWQVQL